MKVVLPLLLTFSVAAANKFDLFLVQMRAKQLTNNLIARTPSDSNASSDACLRPQHFCTDEYFGAVYETCDCDGDGTLDHKCTTLHDDRMWLVLSSEGCPDRWGTSKRQHSQCQIAFDANHTWGISREEIPNLALLTEEGYQQVAALENDEAMLSFARRQLDALGLRTSTEGHLRSWVPWFSGTKSKQSLAAMVNDLNKQDWVLRNDDHPNIVPLTEDGYRKVAALEDEEAMLKFVRRLSGALGMSTSTQEQLRDFIPWFDETTAKHSLAAMVSALETLDMSNIAPLSEKGYQQVAALENDEAMLNFARRQLDVLGLRASTEGHMRGWVPWFSGTKAKQSLAAMVNSLQAQDWVVHNKEMASIAPLSEDGYAQVAALEDDEAMLSFVRRELDALRLRASTQGHLRGWVPWFSGTKAKQTLAAMVDSLHKQDWVFRTDVAGTYALQAQSQQSN